ncbi:MAG: metalloregulator ArsR/SmtB family transcription factor [Bacteroidetes bacterium]|nr:metalloregulator ArsR/SmtB family transcription factor [Bacteroidota bacterium]
MRRDPFQAIADPNRRAILALIARESMNLNTVASHFSVSRPAISKHIKILRQCGLVEIRQKGRERYCEARLERLSEVVAWLEDYRSQWSTEIETAPIRLSTPHKETAMREVSVGEVMVPVPADIPAETIIAAEANDQPEVVEVVELSVVDSIEPTVEIHTPQSDVSIVTQTAAASVPWEDGYVAEQETMIEEVVLDLSAEAVTEQSRTEPTVDTEREPVAEKPDISIEPVKVQTVIPPPARKPTRKKKEVPPADSGQGSLF